MIPLGNKGGVVKIEVSAPAQFRYHKVYGGEKAHTKIHSIDQIGRTITVSRRQVR